MGYPTLAARLNQLKAESNQLELRDLEISTEMKQNSRDSQLEVTKIENYYSEQTSRLQEAYEARKDELSASQSYMESSEYQEALDEAAEQYQEEYNRLQTECEEECAMEEEEATTKETQLETQQTQVEAEMEAVSNEIEAVNDQISSDIERTTIKLS